MRRTGEKLELQLFAQQRDCLYFLFLLSTCMLTKKGHQLKQEISLYGMRLCFDWVFIQRDWVATVAVVFGVCLLWRMEEKIIPFSSSYWSHTEPHPRSVERDAASILVDSLLTWSKGERVDQCDWMENSGPRGVVSACQERPYFITRTKELDSTEVRHDEGKETMELSWWMACCLDME